MATGLTDSKHYTDIANAIREKTGETEQLAPSQMANKVADVYDKGKQDEYDRFWDDLQDNGTKTSYFFTFCGEAWDAETFKPKYIIRPVGASYTSTRSMFYLFGQPKTKPPLDYGTVKDKFDWSQCEGLSTTFANARINYLDLDLPKVTTLYYAFDNGDSLTGRTHISLYITDKCTNYSGSFSYCSELTHLIFKEGSAIVANINISSATKLVKESITSIINALSMAATSKTCTLSEKAVNKAFETSNGMDDGRVSVEWLNLIATKSNWTISLV